MLYCQQCGAPNSPDARFCNQCGAKIASVGEPGGQLDPTVPGRVARAGERDQEPQRSVDISTISLASIGVRSRGRAFGLLGAVALALVGLGAGGAWLAMRPTPESGATAPDPEPVPPELVGGIEIGDLLPQGEEPPEILTGLPRPSASTRAKSARASGTGSPPPERARSGGASTSAAGSISASSGSGGSGGARAGESPAGENPAGENPAGESATGAPSSTSPSSRPTGGTRSEPDWDALEQELGEEPDHEMDAYAMRVRTFVRNYYARRAQNCFELATRNHESVRGTVLVGFDIRADGEIVRVEIVRNTTGIDSIGACLRAQVDSWRLPPPPEGRAPLPMQMPFSR